MGNIFNEEKEYLGYVKESLESEKEYCRKKMREIPKKICKFFTMRCFFGGRIDVNSSN